MIHAPSYSKFRHYLFIPASGNYLWHFSVFQLQRHLTAKLGIISSFLPVAIICGISQYFSYSAILQQS